VKVQQRIPVRIEFTVKNKIEDLKQLRAGMNVQVTIN
jgi:membrane fusion protein (multidrug efflux system)